MESAKKVRVQSISLLTSTALASKHEDTLPVGEPFVLFRKSQHAGFRIPTQFSLDLNIFDAHLHCTETTVNAPSEQLVHVSTATSVTRLPGNHMADRSPDEVGSADS